MKFERTKNASRTFLFGVLSRIISIIGPFVTRTIIIKQLGPTYTGLSGLFTSILTVLSISELGIGAAASYCLYEPIAHDDKKSICALLKLLKTLYNIIGVVILVGGIIVLPFLRYFIKSDVPSEINIYILYCIYLLHSAVSYLSFAYKEVLFKAYQRGDITHGIRAGIEVAKYISQIVFLLFSPNYYVFVAILLLSEIIYIVAVGIISKNTFPGLVPKGTLPQQTISKFKSKVIYLSIHAVSTKLINSADNIIISAFISLEMVTIYGNYSYIYSSVLGLIIIAYTSLHPVIGNTLYTESKERRFEIFDGVWLLSSWVVMWCGTCLLCLYQPFISLWLGKRFLLPDVTMIMVCLYFHANATNQFLTTSYINAAGLWNKTLPREFVAAFVNLSLDIILGKRFGVGGIIFASFFASGFISLPYNMYIVYKHVLNADVKHGIWKLILGFGSFIIIGILTFIICSLIPLSGVLLFVARGLVCVIFPNMVMFALCRRSKDYDFVKGHIMLLLKR